MFWRATLAHSGSSMEVLATIVNRIALRVVPGPSRRGFKSTGQVFRRGSEQLQRGGANQALLTKIHFQNGFKLYPRASAVVKAIC